MKLNEINIRDPFILPYDGKYYMYGSRVGVTPEYPTHWGKQHGFDVFISEDLENWSAPKTIFERGDDFWGQEEFWAPEVHLYRGKFYLFATFNASGKCRGTHILVCDRPDGTFTPVSPSPATPADWECLDGTLYVDNAGKPHIVFCHEWLQIGNGTVCEAELSEDLTHLFPNPDFCGAQVTLLTWHPSRRIGTPTLQTAPSCIAVKAERFCASGHPLTKTATWS